MSQRDGQAQSRAGVAGYRTVEGKLAERQVGCDTPCIQLTELNARYDVVLSASVADLFIGVDGTVVLKPVGTLLPTFIPVALVTFTLESGE